MALWGSQLSFQLTGGDLITLGADSVSAIGAGGATSGWRLDADGGVYWSRTHVSGGAYIKQYDWVIPNSSAANYKCQWSAVTNVVDGTPGAVDTDLALTTDRTWTETNLSAFESCEFQVRIYRVSDNALVATANIYMDVDGS